MPNDSQALLRRLLVLAVHKQTLRKLVEAATAARTPEGRTVALRQNIEAVERIRSAAEKLSAEDQVAAAKLIKYAQETEETVRKVILAGQTSN
jgi:hypothetical protein